MEEEYSASEKQQVIEELEKTHQRLYLQGKIIVFVIATINAVGTIVSAFLNFNLVTLIVQIALSIMLLCGVPWVRYFFAIGAGMSSFLSLYLLFTDLNYAGVNSGYVIYLVIMLVYSIASCIVLFASKSVSEFLYTQRNG